MLVLHIQQALACSTVCILSVSAVNASSFGKSAVGSLGTLEPQTIPNTTQQRRLPFHLPKRDGSVSFC